MTKVRFKVEGLDELMRDMKKLEKVPQRHVTNSARKGMNVVLHASKAKAPVRTGQLKRGMKLLPERSKKGKKVYRVGFDPKKNDIFQKKSVGATQNRVYHGYNRKATDRRLEQKTYYYPYSQEFGFRLRNGKEKPGLRFIRDSMLAKAPEAGQVMVATMRQKIEQELQKARLQNNGTGNGAGN